jgi:catabolite regulation protein CreA
VEIIIVNPEIAVKAMHNPALEDFACEVTGVMRKVINRLS